MIAVSLLICTHNRASQLGDCLAAVAASVNMAATSGLQTEVVMVDNASTDRTSEVLAQWAAKQLFPVTLVFEPRAGLAFARNAGLTRARGDIVSMTDDDCVVELDFISAVASAFAEDKVPTIRGGRVDLGNSADLPISIKTETTPRTLLRWMMPGGFILGANFALKRELFEKIGAFDERFGAGAPFKAAEDTDYVVRAQALGVPVLYDPRIVVRHFHGRRSQDELVSLYRGYGFGDGALFAKHFLRNHTIRKLFARSLLWGLRDLIRDSNPDDVIKRKATFKAFHQIRGFIAYSLNPSPRNAANSVYHASRG